MVREFRCLSDQNEKQKAAAKNAAAVFPTTSAPKDPYAKVLSHTAEQVF
jgi:hypothetical protein